MNWLRWLCNWATEWQDEAGRYVMRENPRPVASHDRYEASHDRYEKVRARADQVMMEIRWDGHRKKRRSYLPEILELVAGTGRRITPSARSVRKISGSSRRPQRRMARFTGRRVPTKWGGSRWSPSRHQVAPHLSGRSRAEASPAAISSRARLIRRGGEQGLGPTVAAAGGVACRARATTGQCLARIPSRVGRGQEASPVLSSPK